ncbi:E3 ubiquitin-protein ligase RING1-like [Linum grandiflorum]
MNHRPSFLNSGVQSIDGVAVLDGSMLLRPPRRVSRTETVARQTGSSQFHRSNPNSQPPRRLWQTATVGRRTGPAQFHRSNPNSPPPPSPAMMSVLATLASQHGSPYPEADLQRQRRRRPYNVRIEFNPEDGTAVIMTRPRLAGREFYNETEAAVAASAEEYETRTTGASESAIAKLERVKIGGGSKRDDCCTICLEEMGSDEGKAAIKLDCGHEFHENCLVSWLRTSNCCPLCRFQIQDS